MSDSTGQESTGPWPFTDPCAPVRKQRGCIYSCVYKLDKQSILSLIHTATNEQRIRRTTQTLRASHITTQLHVNGKRSPLRWPLHACEHTVPHTRAVSHHAAPIACLYSPHLQHLDPAALVHFRPCDNAPSMKTTRGPPSHASPSQGRSTWVCTLLSYQQRVSSCA